MLKLNSIFAALLYTALSVTAIAAHATDYTAIEALREGKMRNLIFHGESKDVSKLPFTTPEGDEFSLSDYEGKFVLLNFWATWCVPCRHEMPAFNQLSQTFSSDNFDVVTVASGHNPLPAIRKFYTENQLEHLPVLLDPRSKFSREMGVLSLPITVLIDPEGMEIARMRGDADWFSPSAQNIVRTIIDPSPEDSQLPD